ncbi:hypothetical protein [Bradyrhizobium liaoningense]
MSLQTLFAPVRKLTPSFIHKPVRRLATAFLTPILFSAKTGHFRSSLNSSAFDRSGERIPWYTYPAIDLLSQKSFRNKRVLEFGGGHSTVWWAKRCQTIVSFDANESWVQSVKPLLPTNASITHVADPTMPTAPLIDGNFDVIIIDGLDRFRATEISSGLLKPGGAFIVDNSDGFWGPEGTWPIVTHLFSKGFSRVDFYGFAPGVVNRHCTSIAFKDRCFLFDADDHPTRMDSR